MQHPPESSNAGRLPRRANRKKDPKTKEEVWPHHLETCLLDGLGELGGRRKGIGRCIFLSEYMKKKTGIYRSPQQISSRLQQIKKGRNTYLADLARATQRKSPTRPPYTQVFRFESASHAPRKNYEGLSSYQEIISPLIASTSLSPHSESVDPPMNRDEWAIANYSLKGDPQSNTVEDLDKFFSPDADASSASSAVNNLNDDLLWEQANPYNHTNSYLQQVAATSTQYAQESHYSNIPEIDPGVGGEPNPDNVFLWELFNSQYPHPGYQ